MRPPAGSHSCVEGEPHHQRVRRNRPCAKPAHWISPRRPVLLVLDPDLTVKFADRSFGDAFTVTPKDTPRDQEGQQ
jgi:hypothetical protein